MAKIGLPKGSGKQLKVREKSVKSQGILKWILSGNSDMLHSTFSGNMYRHKWCNDSARCTENSGLKPRFNFLCLIMHFQFDPMSVFLSSVLKAGALTYYFQFLQLKNSVK